jgi:hypothetical protein
MIIRHKQNKNNGYAYTQSSIIQKEATLLILALLVNTGQQDNLSFCSNNGKEF